MLAALDGAAQLGAWPASRRSSRAAVAVDSAVARPCRRRGRRAARRGTPAAERGARRVLLDGSRRLLWTDPTWSWTLERVPRGRHASSTGPRWPRQRHQRCDPPYQGGVAAPPIGGPIGRTGQRLRQSGRRLERRRRRVEHDVELAALVRLHRRRRTARPRPVHRRPRTARRRTSGSSAATRSRIGRRIERQRRRRRTCSPSPALAAPAEPARRRRTRTATTCGRVVDGDEQVHDCGVALISKNCCGRPLGLDARHRLATWSTTGGSGGLVASIGRAPPDARRRRHHDDADAEARDHAHRRAAPTAIVAPLAAHADALELTPP